MDLNSVTRHLEIGQQQPGALKEGSGLTVQDFGPTTARDIKAGILRGLCRGSREWM